MQKSRATPHLFILWEENWKTVIETHANMHGNPVCKAKTEFVQFYELERQHLVWPPVFLNTAWNLLKLAFFLNDSPKLSTEFELDACFMLDWEKKSSDNCQVQGLDWKKWKSSQFLKTFWKAGEVLLKTSVKHYQKLAPWMQNIKIGWRLLHITGICFKFSIIICWEVRWVMWDRLFMHPN